jgi:hypothetical protein
LDFGSRNNVRNDSQVRSSAIEDTRPLPSSLAPCDFFMTRITNFGRKRTHVEATFNYSKADLEDSDAELLLGQAADESTTNVTDTKGAEITGDGHGADGQPPKKKRKRGPRKKARAKEVAGTGDNGEGGEKGEGDGKDSNGSSEQRVKKKKSKLRTLQGSFSLYVPKSSF